MVFTAGHFTKGTPHRPRRVEQRDVFGLEVLPPPKTRIVYDSSTLFNRFKTKTKRYQLKATKTSKSDPFFHARKHPKFTPCGRHVTWHPAGVLARLANLFNKAGDETQAFHYHLESYRYWPVDMNVITWLGIYYVKQEMYEAGYAGSGLGLQIHSFGISVLLSRKCTPSSTDMALRTLYTIVCAWYPFQSKTIRLLCSSLTSATSDILEGNC